MLRPLPAPRANRFTVMGHSLSRSYGVILQSSLTRVLSSALGYSPCLPVSVYSTVTTITHYEVFLGSMGSTSLCRKRLLITSQCLQLGKRICLLSPPTGLNQDNQRLDGLPFHVTPSLKRYYGGTGILTCFPSPTPFGLGLGTD